MSDVLEFVADHKRMAALSPSEIKKQIQWLALKEEGKTESALVLGLSKPAGIVKGAMFSFSSTEDGKGWVLNSLELTCTVSFTKAGGQMRKLFGKPKSSRKGAMSWQFRDGWGISLTGATGGVVVTANPNEDIAE